MKSATFIPLLLLAGCAAVGPDYTPPEAPATEAELLAGDGLEVESLASWWENFRDPLLSEFIETGLKNSPTVEQALANYLAARATREKTEAGFWPQFTADGSYTWSKQNGAVSTKWEDRVGASVDASWELDLFGRVRRLTEQAAAEEARLAYTVKETHVALAAEIASAYVMARRYAIQIDIAKENINLQERSVARIKRRYESGDVPRYDVMTAEAQIARTRATLPQLEQNLRAAQLELDALLGLPPYSTQAKIAEFPPVLRLPDTLPKVLPNDLLRRRADVRMAEEAVHAQTAAVGVAEAAFYPTFRLGGSIGVSSPDLTPWSDYTRSVNLGPSVSWNVFGFGTWEKQLESAKATLEARVAGYRETVLQAYREVETAWNACKLEAERSEDLLLAERSYTAALEIADKLYEFGEKDIEDVLNQQANLLTAREAVTIHNFNRLTNLITLYKALGGGWTDEQPDAEAEAAEAN